VLCVVDKVHAGVPGLMCLCCLSPLCGGNCAFDLRLAVLSWVLASQRPFVRQACMGASKREPSEVQHGVCVKYIELDYVCVVGVAERLTSNYRAEAQSQFGCFCGDRCWRGCSCFSGTLLQQKRVVGPV
jgi:hypothetical protein